MIEYRIVNIRELESLLDDRQNSDDSIVLMSRHRFISFKNNPRLRPEDPVGIICYDGKKIIGYRFLLHDELYLDDEMIPFSWCSTIWLNPDYRGKGIGLELYKKGNKIGDKMTLGSDPVPMVEKQFYRSGEYILRPLVLNGVRIYRRSQFAHILPTKWSIFYKLKPILSVCDKMVDFILLSMNKRSYTLPNSASQLTSIDKEVSQFINIHNADTLFKRTGEDLNWILRFPWILNQKDKSSNHGDYYFSAYDPEFRSIMIVLRDKRGKLCTLLYFVVVHHHLKLHYYLGEESPKVIDVIGYLAEKYDVNTISIFEDSVIKYLKKSVGIPGLKKSIKRHYMVSKKLYEVFDNHSFNVHSGDGDGAFT